MRLSRTDPIPVLTIVTGGVIGAALSFGFLALFPSGEVPGTIELLYERSTPVESPTRVPVRVGTVTGQVTDALTRSPVATAEVYIAGLKLGGVSQRNGRYLLQNVPAGAYTVSVTRMGYRTTAAQITVGGGETVEQNFSVAEEALQLHEVSVVVPATRPCLTQRMVPAPPDRGLEQRSSITIRGYSPIPIANQPPIYIDGVRYLASDCPMDGLDPDDIENIEIFRSPEALRRYGEEGSKGAIAITLTEEARRRR